MALSRQFKALVKIAGFFAAAFSAVGVVVGVSGGDLAPSVLLTRAIAYAALGGMSGTGTALLLSWFEIGRLIEEVPTWRVTAWGVIGGAAPAALLTVLGLTFGSSAATLLPLLGLGVVGAGLGGLVSGSAAAAAKSGALNEAEGRPQIPTSWRGARRLEPCASAGKSRRTPRSRSVGQ